MKMKSFRKTKIEEVVEIEEVHYDLFTREDLEEFKTSKLFWLLIWEEIELDFEKEYEREELIEIILQNELVKYHIFDEHFDKETHAEFIKYERDELEKMKVADVQSIYENSPLDVEYEGKPKKSDYIDWIIEGELSYIPEDKIDELYTEDELEEMSLVHLFHIIMDSEVDIEGSFSPSLTDCIEFILKHNMIKHYLLPAKLSKLMEERKNTILASEEELKKLNNDELLELAIHMYPEETLEEYTMSDLIHLILNDDFLPSVDEEPKPLKEENK